MPQGQSGRRRPQASLVSEPERASPLLAKVLPVSCPLPSSELVTEAGNLSGEDGIQALATMPIAVWNVPSDNAKSPPGKVAEPKMRKTKTKIGENKDSLLSNAELAVGAISSILKDFDIGRSKELPVDEALALSFQGFASISL